MKNEEQDFVWEGYGLRLHVPQNSLPDDGSQLQCHLKIAVSLSGNFVVPEDGVLVSAVYSFTNNWGDRELRNPVTLEMQHCATDRVLSGLQILKASADSKRFEIVQGGEFHPGYAVIKLKNFSSFGIWLQNRFYSLFRTLEYRAKLYYTDVEYLSFQSDFYILPNLDANFRVCILYIETAVFNLLHFLQQAIERKLKQPFVPGPTSQVEFEHEKMYIDIDQDGVTSGGWKLVPLNPIVVNITQYHEYIHDISPCWLHKFQMYKRDVNRFPSGRGVQSCQMHITWVGQDGSKVKQLQYKMVLNGANEERNFLTIVSPSACTS